MRYSNTTLKELTTRYKHVLLKCALMNAVIVAGTMMATPVMAAISVPAGTTGTLTQNASGDFSPNGGVANNNGTLTVSDDLVFDKNVANNGGVIYNVNASGATSYSTLTVGNNVKFNNNTAFDNIPDQVGTNGAGGAVYVMGGANPSTMTTGNNVSFSGNQAVKGGALFVEDGNVSFGEGATFTNNSSGKNGGAIYNWDYLAGNTELKFGKNAVFSGNSAGTVGGAIANYGGKITFDEGAKFTNNTAGKNGGALANIEVDGQHTPTMTIAKDSSFTGNSAKNGFGGAIYNHGDLTVTGTTFDSNTASVGGAIYNNEKSNITFTGDNTFENNFNAGTLNDIFNDGTITNSGNMFLNSGLVNNGTFTNTGVLSLDGITEINSAIDNTGGTITFVDGSSLKTSLMNGTSIITGSTGTVTGKTNLIIGNNSEMGSFGIEGTNDLSFKSNALYDITDENGTYTVSKKSASQVADSLAGQGVNNTQAITMVGMTEAKPTSAQGQAIADAITTAIQSGDTAGAARLVDAVNPVSTPVVQTQAVGSAAQVMNVASTRMSSAGEGRSGGSMADFAYGPWIQGLYNKTHNSQGAGFDGYSQGFAAGVDVDVTDSTMLGVAYAYTATDINSNGRKTKVYGDNYMIYGKYQPNEWYVDGALNYGHGSYHENSLGLKSKYNVDTYGGQALVGYQTGIFDNYAGARYVYVNPEKYSNGLTEVNAKNSQVGTAIIGTKISKEYKNHGVVWKPEFRLAATYDVKSDNSSSNVSIVGGNTTYTVHGKRLSRGAIQPGLGLKATVNNLDVVLGYDAEFRSEQTSQTGTLKLQYNF